jgi:hypothetical protein
MNTPKTLEQQLADLQDKLTKVQQALTQMQLEDARLQFNLGRDEKAKPEPPPNSRVTGNSSMDSFCSCVPTSKPTQSASRMKTPKCDLHSVSS